MGARVPGTASLRYTHVVWTVRYFPLWSRHKALNLLDWGNKIPDLRKCLAVCCLSNTVSHLLRFCRQSSFTSQKNFSFHLLLPPSHLNRFFPPPEHPSFVLLPTHWRQQKAYSLDYTLWFKYMLCICISFTHNGICVLLIIRICTQGYPHTY